MSVARIAGRYAKSLVAMAGEAGVLDTVYQDMNDIRQAVHESRDFAILLKSPVVKSEKKKDILDSILKSQHGITRQFMSYLVDKKREEYTGQICEAFIQQYHEIKGIALATVTSAFALDGATIKSVKEYLAGTFSLDQIILENKVDNSIIGGMIIQYEDRRLDMSVKKEIQEIKKQLIYN